MIAYDLKCARGHVFEAWFRDSATYEKQRRGGKAPCPVCGDTKVEKALMTPNVTRGREADTLAPETQAAGEAMKALIKLREQVEKHCDDVGANFAEEARKIHFGEVEKRSIYGQTTPDEAEELKEDGVEFGEIPWVPRHDS
jgi:hypothetical protein